MLLLLRQQWQLQQLIIRAPVFAYSYNQARSLVNVKLKWVKDRTLDSVVAGEKALRAACELKDMLANSPETCLPIYTLSRRRQQLGLGELKVSTFLRQYPTLFQELTRKNSDLLCFQLTEDALKLYQEELQILQQHEMDLILRLRKLLMITAERTLPLQTIDQLKWDMGLPHDYQQTLIPHYPQFFGLVKLSDNRIGLKLLHWDNQLAVSELQKNGGGYGSSQNLAFPVKFTRGFGLKRKCMAWLSEWQQLPYTSPYADPSNLDPRTDESELSCVVPFHLHLQVLKWEDVEVGEPKEGEIRVRNKAVGLNFVDVYYRKGIYKTALPYTPGHEAAGVVTAVGPGLTGWKVGDIVAIGGNQLASYTEEQIIPASIAVHVPPSIDPIVAASIMIKGMTAQFLVCRCFKVEPGHTVLVHAAAGGVGSLLCQWASGLGATVIGTVSTEAKAAQAAEDGCHHVIIYTQEDFAVGVDKITSGKGVDVVYDSVGKDTFQGSLACLKPRGYMVNYGQSSGTPDPVPLSALAAKSLFLTRPLLRWYNTTREELLECCNEVFAKVESGTLRVRVNHTYPLSHAAQAHADLESRKTSGSVVLIPDTV